MFEGGVMILYNVTGVWWDTPVYYRGILYRFLGVLDDGGYLYHNDQFRWDLILRQRPMP